MNTYRVTAYETVLHEVIYEVEADNAEEAENYVLSADAEAVEDTSLETKHREVSKPVRLLLNLHELADYFSCLRPSQLNRTIYKATACGASISAYCANDVAFHNGDDWSELDAKPNLAKAITVQTIVEGSDLTFDSERMHFPIDADALEQWFETMEQQAFREWARANGDHYLVLSTEHEVLGQFSDVWGSLETKELQLSPETITQLVDAYQSRNTNLTEQAEFFVLIVNGQELRFERYEPSPFDA